MNDKARRIVPALIGMLVFAGISLSPTLSQNRQRPLVAASEDPDFSAPEGRSYSPEGAWFCSVKFPGWPSGVPYMDIYTSDSNGPRVSGTVLCTLSVGKFPSPMGMVSMTQAGHGNWIRLEKNTFAFTALRILLDADGHPVGTAKFWGTLTATAEDETSGTMNAEYYDSKGALFNRISGGISTGKKIEVVVEQQE